MKLLLLKLPYCRHPDAPARSNPRVQNSYRPLPSLALATLSAFLKTYGPAELRVRAVDMNLVVYSDPRVFNPLGLHMLLAAR